MPIFRPYFSQLSESIFTTSPLPFIQGLFLTLCSVVEVCHRQNPSWCFAVMITPVEPEFFIISHHWSVSRAVGLNVAGSSFPVPHCTPVKVFIPKWMKL